MFTKFGQHKQKFWGSGYNDLCYNTHNIIIFLYQSAPTTANCLTGTQRFAVAESCDYMASSCYSIPEQTDISRLG